MEPFSTTHFSWPISVHPVRFVPLNNGTQSSPGSFVPPDCACRHATRSTGIEARDLQILRSLQFVFDFGGDSARLFHRTDGEPDGADPRVASAAIVLADAGQVVSGLLARPGIR